MSPTIRSQISALEIVTSNIRQMRRPLNYSNPQIELLEKQLLEALETLRAVERVGG